LRCNAGDLLHQHLVEHAERTALITGDRRWTYHELAQLCDRAGGGLRDSGVRASDRVMFALEDSAELVALLIGAMRIGAVPVPVNPRLSGTELTFHFDDCEPVAIVADDSVQAVLDLAGHTPAVAATTAGDDALWQYTSGSTGSPKAAVHTHASIAALADWPRDVLPMHRDDIVLCVGKLYTSMGGFMLMNALHAGAAYCLLTGAPAPLVMATAIQQFRPTLYCGLPSNYAGMLMLPFADFRSLRTCIAGGERLSTTLLERWRSTTGQQILNVLASTEIGGPALISRRGSGDPTRLELIKGFRASVVDSFGTEVEAPISGELLATGPTRFDRYWSRDVQMQPGDRDGWVRTGDRCMRHEDGTFEYIGRMNDMLRFGGKWVDPAAVEAIVNQHPAVAESAIAGRPDRNGVLVAAAFVVLRGGYAADAISDLRDYLGSRLPSNEIPRVITIVDALPKTPAGKIRRFMLGTSETHP